MSILSPVSATFGTALVKYKSSMFISSMSYSPTSLLYVTRDMKEKMAGPGDTYAKDTRAYNPEFAAAAGDEEEYDKKIQEVGRSLDVQVVAVSILPFFTWKHYICV